MKINKSYKALLFIGILTMSAFLFFNTISTTQAAEISTDIQAGDTIWYTVEEFTPLGDLITPDDPSEGTITGTLVGSQVYVKVMNVQKETLTYYDGSVVKTGLVPTVDISTGGILGSSITLTVPSNTSDTGFEDVILPAGAGLPFPITFGTTTVFNVTDMPESVLPLPLVLNDDYAMHEAVANEAKTALASEGWTMTITNDAAEFALDVHGEDPNSTNSLDVSGSWRKTDGLLQSIELTADINGTQAHMKLGLETKEYKPLKLNVGDDWQLTLDDVGFNYELAGFDATEQADAATQLDAIIAVMDGLSGKVLLDLTVAEIDGLYYRVEGSTYDGELDAMVPLDGDVWLAGFGTLNYQLPRLMVSSSMDTFGFTEADYQRLLSGPGFAITEDWAIYEAFDFSISAVLEGYETLLVEALAAETDVTGTLDISYNGRPTNGGYQLDTSTDFDLTGPLDDGDPATADATITIQQSTSGKMVYDKYGLLTELSFKGSGSVSLTTGESVSITNARFVLKSNFQSDEPLVDNVGDDGNDAVSGGDDSGPGLDVPGFDFYLAIISIMSFGLIIRKRRY
ncbi:MAG: hypothetical protein GPJ54_14150 [Candidatus Heimdallarchaeota archaeon]|nr:hypothetical protein [Candidatus Heimdallarchaeota archaeon]